MTSMRSGSFLTASNAVVTSANTEKVTPDTVYIGQQTTYQVAVFIDEETRRRMRRYPGFSPPELRGVAAYDIPAMRELLPLRSAGNRRYEPHVYQRALFPLIPGRIVMRRSEA